MCFKDPFPINYVRGWFFLSRRAASYLIFNKQSSKSSGAGDLKRVACGWSHIPSSGYAVYPQNTASGTEKTFY